MRFRTNLDEWVEAGPERPIRVAPGDERSGPRPYVLVREGLEALILRPVFYELVALAVPKTADARVGGMDPRSIFPADRSERTPLTRVAVEASFSRQPRPGRRLIPSGPDELALRGDHDLNPELRPSGTLRPAAVLVPLIERKDGIQVLLTLRTPHLNAHAGQISFPGGRIDAADADATAAALREAEEEVGIPPDRVEIIGRLDTYWTRTGFEIVPVSASSIPR